MSIRNTYPTIRPSLNLDFARSRTLDPRITFSRTSTGTYMDSDGLIKVASADEARFDHRYVNGQLESLGLLVEESRVNSLRYSNDFSQTNWTKQNSHPVPTQDVVGPDGVSNSGWRFYRTATNQYIYQQVAGTGTHTLSAWVRSSAETGSFRLSAFNAIDGTMSTTFTATNEWQRFSMTISTTTNTNYYPCIPANTNEDFYVWGAQLELNGSFPTSYIPTSGGTATRNPDNASITGENFSDWYNQSEFSLFANFKIDAPQQSFDTFVTIDDGTTSPKITFYRGNLDSRIRLFSHNMGGIIGTSNVESGLDAINKSAYAIAPNNTSIFLNGNLEVTNTVASNPIVSGSNTIRFGCDAGNGATPNTGRFILSKLSYYPRRLSNSELQNLTK